MEQNDFINAMGEADIREQLEKYKDNPSVVTLLEGVLEARIREEEQLAIQANFVKDTGKLAKKLIFPESVYNVLIRRAEVDVEDTSVEPEEVDIVDAEGNHTTESRYPSHKEWQNIVEPNKGFSVSRGGDGVTKVSKRAITIYKRDGLALENKGNFPSASKACEKLGLAIGGDSATRVLARESYIVEPFTGELTS